MGQYILHFGSAANGAVLRLHTEIHIIVLKFYFTLIIFKFFVVIFLSLRLKW